MKSTILTKRVVKKDKEIDFKIAKTVLILSTEDLLRSASDDLRMYASIMRGNRFNTVLIPDTQHVTYRESAIWSYLQGTLYVGTVLKAEVLFYKEG